MRILYRQNNSWQGEVLWAEQEEKRCFKSTLELLKLIDGAMDQEAAEDTEKTEKTEKTGTTAWQNSEAEGNKRKSARQERWETGWRE